MAHIFATDLQLTDTSTEILNSPIPKWNRTDNALPKENQKMTNMKNITSMTCLDLLHFTMMETQKSQHTRRDYGDAIKRLPNAYGRNRLEDIQMDLSDFQARFHRKAFDPSMFKTKAAYLAWRRKVIAAMKEFSGTSRPQSFDDGWSILQRRADAFVRTHLDFHTRSPLSLATLAAVARQDGISPHGFSREYITKKIVTLDSVKARSVRKGCMFIDRLRDEAPDLLGVLPPASIGSLPSTRRGKLPSPPDNFLIEMNTWITEYCAGEIDEITGDADGEKSDATRNNYRAAFKKYLGYAQRSGLLQNVTTLRAALRDDIALAVMREMIACNDPTLRLAERVQCQYLEDICRLSKSRGIEPGAILRALKTNKTLKSGKKQRAVMSPKSKKFCQWLLASRQNEMLYRSLHIRFHNRAIELMSRLSHEHVPDGWSEVRRLGTLAAMSAIWAWGVPLRVGNMCSLTLYGDKPQIFLPMGKTVNLRIVVAKEETKNDRGLNHRISPGRHRGIEIVEWYISTIRPLIPGAENSKFLFPAPGGSGKAIGTGVVGTWLGRKAAQEGIVITPHHFRHAAASLYIRQFPGAYDHVAQLLDDTPEVVHRYYSWIDEEAVLTDVQNNIMLISGFNNV